MKYLVFFLASFIMLFFIDFGFWSNVAILLWVWSVIQLLSNSANSIAFREFFMVLYGLNYLLAPALAYRQNQSLYGTFSMKIPEVEYFALAIPGVIALQIGLFLVKTKAFKPDFTKGTIRSLITEPVLSKLFFVGIICAIGQPFIAGELSFVLYLIGGVRFIAAFGLFAISKSKYKWYLIGVFGLELLRSLAGGMFNDVVTWILFFGLFYSYIAKISASKKILLSSVAFLCFFILQVSKNDYRERTWRGGQEGGIAMFEEVANSKIKKGLFTETNIAGSLSRVNQAWIFASTVQNLNSTRDFQGLKLVGLYFESALLPRFLAPNKLTSGNKEIFNRFSGHYIEVGTSMGLGIFADGYIAYKDIGVILFGFAFGLLFGLVFKIIENWMEISPYFVLFVFPLLIYAVRPDCETQTIIGHTVKGLITFGLMMAFYKGYFHKKILYAAKRQKKHELSLTSTPAI